MQYLDADNLYNYGCFCCSRCCCLDVVVVLALLPSALLFNPIPTHLWHMQLNMIEPFPHLWRVGERGREKEEGRIPTN